MTEPPRFKVSARVPDGEVVVGVPVFAGREAGSLSPSPELDARFLASRGFEGRPGEAVAMPARNGTTVVALGVGPEDAVGRDELRRAGAALARQAGPSKTAATTLAAAARCPDDVAAAVEGIGLGAYQFDGTRRSASPRPPLSSVAIVGGTSLRAPVAAGRRAVEATWQARDWVNTPPRQLTPSRLAELASALAAPAGVAVEVWDGERIAAERLGGLAAVAAGAQEPARLVRLEWNPGSAKAKVALVGKGITFDSGGLSLKPAASMMTMKSDMAGAAAVVTALVAAARARVPVHVVGWVPATENMPGGRALHPGDVFVARNGTSVEVLNTDAEGRLVLADALSLAAEEHPDVIVDIATLTGGQRVALGPAVAAVLGSSSALIDRVQRAGSRAGEPTWELPLVDAYRKQLDSEVADLRNVTGEAAASTIMAALFLQEFTGGLPWAHLDIAAPSWAGADDGWLTKGATGWGARTLLELLAGWS